jgi:hypothetical protein
MRTENHAQAFFYIAFGERLIKALGYIAHALPVGA